jgi:hypothetical protein
VIAITPFVVAAALGFRKIARETVTHVARAGGGQFAYSGICEWDCVAKTFRQEHTIYDEFVNVNKQSYRINLWSGYVF